MEVQDIAEKNIRSEAEHIKFDNDTSDASYEWLWSPNNIHNIWTSILYPFKLFE